MFLQSLEAELNGIGVRKEDFKQILVSKLPCKTKETILDLLGREDSTYDMLKSRLLDKVGLSKREVEIKLFVEWEKVAKSLDRVERCKRLESLVNRFVLGAKSVKEVALSLMVALFRIGLPVIEQGLIDSRPIKSYSDLFELATTLKSANIRPKVQYRSERKDDRSSLTCVALDAKAWVIKVTNVRQNWITQIGR